MQRAIPYSSTPATLPAPTHNVPRMWSDVAKTPVKVVDMGGASPTLSAPVADPTNLRLWLAPCRVESSKKSQRERKLDARCTIAR